MIGFTPDDGAGTIDLLGEEKPYHLVAEGHARERNLLVGTLIDSRRKAIGTTDDEDQPLGRLLLLL